MQFKDDILHSYMSSAPLPLAFERAVEGTIYKSLPFDRPILDIGCGDGLFAKIVFAEPLDTGIDPDGRELEHAKRLSSYKELIKCRGDAIPKSDATYGTIISNSVLEHIPEIEPVLREAFRLLKPGGRFYATVPSEKFELCSMVTVILTALRLHHLALRYRRFFNSFWRHFHAYPVETWSSLAMRCGFRVTKAFRYEDPSYALRNDLLTPFSLPAFCTKRIINRWVLFPTVRRVLSSTWATRYQKTVENNAKHASKDGVLVFLSLMKP